jgi:hypothetical protein
VEAVDSVPDRRAGFNPRRSLLGSISEFGLWLCNNFIFNWLRLIISRWVDYLTKFSVATRADLFWTFDMRILVAILPPLL